MLLAYLLDSNYCRRSLAQNSTTIIESFIKKYYPKDSAIIWKQIIFYRTQSGIFDIKLAWDTVDKDENFKFVAPQLTKLAIRIFSIPCSSAASERNWSAFSYIHDKKKSFDESFNNTEDEINDYDIRIFLEDKIDNYGTKTFLENSDDENYANTNKNKSNKENRIESEEEDKSDEKENRSDEEESNEEKNRDSEEESNEENRDEENIYYDL
ncbi:9451_t:CDS:2 [Gigaspora margarita]|uniref:9451_t:CDS:1 n=1 Tax=Gigaspora margarita TaxID=4874 RepID=A0ABN7WHR4_GIGMA|nr:9451_t:CDS:2 [Gigaspora margarita]